MSHEHRSIAVISAGGTFGMLESARGLAPAPVEQRIASLLADEAAAADGESAIHSITELAPQIDSANATPTSWQVIVDAINALPAEVDGVVVVHGTDTMAYSTAAVAYATAASPVPIVFTGAQKPIAVEGSDGPGNLIAAFRRVLERDSGGVELAFGGDVIPGTRAVKVSATAFQAFAWSHPDRTDLEGTASTLGFRGYRDSDIPVIRLYPGITARTVSRLLDGASAAVLQCYAYGNAPVATPGIIDVLAAAAENGCVVVAVSQLLDGTIALGASAVSSALLGAGIVEGGDLTTEAALTKLHYLRSTDATDDEVRRAIGEPIAGEISVLAARS
jgi:L-asparaginase